MKEKVLFVDDDPALLEGLRRVLRTQRQVWDMTFVEDSTKAVTLLAQGQFDVVVSDLRMPKLNGAEFLSEVKKLCPSSVRIILSGQADIDLVTEAIVSAHQFLLKPCAKADLLDTICDAAALRTRLGATAVRERAFGAIGLPCQERVLAHFLEELSRPQPSLDKVAQLVAADVGLSVQILKLINFGSFGTRWSFTGIPDAVCSLGLDTLIKISRRPGVFVGMGAGKEAEKILLQINSHSLQVAQLSRRMAEEDNVQPALLDMYFAAGLVHDIGRIALLSYFPEQYVQMQGSNLPATDFRESEQKLFACSHCEVGAFLLGLWGLPHTLVDATAEQHDSVEIAGEMTARTGVARAIVCAADLAVANRNSLQSSART